MNELALALLTGILLSDYSFDLVHTFCLFVFMYPPRTSFSKEWTWSMPLIFPFVSSPTPTTLCHLGSGFPWAIYTWKGHISLCIHFGVGVDVRSFNFTHFIWLWVLSSCPAGLTCRPFKTEQSTLCLPPPPFEFSHIKNPEGSLSHYEIQTALQTTYLLYFLSFPALSAEADLSLFVFLGRQPYFLLATLPDALAGYPCNGKEQ